jgi:hypothetical protein
VIEHLRRSGFETLPALGYGAIQRGGFASWFCVLNAPTAAPLSGRDLMKGREAAERMAAWYGRTQKRLKELSTYLLLNGAASYDGEVLRKDFHCAHIADADDSPLSLLSYYLFDINYVLYSFRDGSLVPKESQECTAARRAYLKALLGREFTVEQILALRPISISLKYRRGLAIRERLRILGGHPITRLLLDEFLDGSSCGRLLSELRETAPPRPQGLRERASRYLAGRLERWSYRLSMQPE